MYDDNVSAGVELLDNHFGGRDNWLPDLLEQRERFDVSSVYDCVLGILYDPDREAPNDHGADTGWGKGMEELFGTTSEDHGPRYGFDTFNHDYYALQEAWDAWLDANA